MTASNPSPPGGIDYIKVEQSEKFRRLKRTRQSFVFPLAVFFMLWYFLYVLLSTFARDFMATPVIGNINLGLLLGLLQFVTTFTITMWYVSFANKRLDPMSEELRSDLAALESEEVTR